MSVAITRALAPGEVPERMKLQAIWNPAVPA
jgi:hypothetical protein